MFKMTRIAATVALMASSMACVSLASAADDVMFSTGGYARGGEGLRTMKVMKVMDKDSDKRVSKDEFIEMHEATFDKMDKNQDGMISTEEWMGKERRSSTGATSAREPSKTTRTSPSSTAKPDAGTTPAPGTSFSDEARNQQTPSEGKTGAGSASPSRGANAPRSTPADGKSYSSESEKQQSRSEGVAGPVGSPNPSKGANKPGTTPAEGKSYSGEADKQQNR